MKTTLPHFYQSTQAFYKALVGLITVCFIALLASQEGHAKGGISTVADVMQRAGFQTTRPLAKKKRHMLTAFGVKPGSSRTSGAASNNTFQLSGEAFHHQVGRAPRPKNLAKKTFDKKDSSGKKLRVLDVPEQQAGSFTTNPNALYSYVLVASPGADNVMFKTPKGTKGYDKPVARKQGNKYRKAKTNEIDPSLEIFHGDLKNLSHRSLDDTFRQGRRFYTMQRVTDESTSKTSYAWVEIQFAGDGGIYLTPLPKSKGLHASATQVGKKTKVRAARRWTVQPFGQKRKHQIAPTDAVTDQSARKVIVAPNASASSSRSSSGTLHQGDLAAGVAQQRTLTRADTGALGPTHLASLDVSQTALQRDMQRAGLSSGSSSAAPAAPAAPAAAPPIPPHGLDLKGTATTRMYGITGQPVTLDLTKKLPNKTSPTDPSQLNIVAYDINTGHLFGYAKEHPKMGTIRKAQADVAQQVPGHEVVLLERSVDGTKWNVYYKGANNQYMGPSTIDAAGTVILYPVQ